MNLQELINSDKVTIVDVRTEHEFAGSRLEESINIPLNEIPHHVEEIRAMQPVVIYCAAGVRSAQAVSFLKQEGLTEVYDGGGINDLRQKLNK